MQAFRELRPVGRCIPVRRALLYPSMIGEMEGLKSNFWSVHDRTLRKVPSLDRDSYEA